MLDPVTGKEVTTPPPPTTVSVPADEWASVKARLDVFERVGFGRPAPAPSAPPAPTGPTLVDQCAAVERQIDALDSQIDDLVHQGKPVSKLLKERSKLDRQITRLQVKHEDIDPAMAAGIRTIDQISDEITRGKMTHLSIVKDDYEASLSSLPAEQRMDPKIRKAAYDMAVGKNITKIMEVQREEMLRKPVEPPTDAPPTGSSRTKALKAGEVPKPEDFLPADNLAAIQSLGKTPDEYFRQMGHKDGFAGWYKKHHAPKA